MTSVRAYARRRDWPMPKPPPYPADDEGEAFVDRVLLPQAGLLGAELTKRLGLDGVEVRFDTEPVRRAGYVAAEIEFDDGRAYLARWEGEGGLVLEPVELDREPPT